MSGTKQKSDLGTNVRSLVPADRLLRRFNELNQTIVSGLPEIARAYDALHRHLPLLREMQALLSQRPKQPTAVGFRMLSRQMPISDRSQLPTWTQWIEAYAAAIDYSVRHIRRLILSEAPIKTVKECGWSITDHNNLIRAATAAFDLVRAVEHGADTTLLVQEIREIMGDVREDLLDKTL